MVDRHRVTQVALQSPAVAEPVTGVASGGLGTAANLEDTQLWLLEDLREPDPPREPERSREPKPLRKLEPRHPPSRAATPSGIGPQLVRARVSHRRTGVAAAAVVGVLALASLLAARDGFPDGATRGSGEAAGAFPSLPPISTNAPAPTAPDAGGKGSGGNGRGGGHGNDHGGENGHGGGGDD